MNYKFIFNEKEYELNEDNCIDIINDEEKPLEGLDLKEILRLLSESDEVSFEKAYYNTYCEECRANFKETRKESEYLEYYFYAYSKDGKYVISTIAKEYENKTFNKMELMGEVDDSYMVSIIVCLNCGEYLVQIEELLV